MANQDFDVIVVGAGFAGMYMLYRLRKMGMTARAFEAGADVGGTWYWNRYPGARVDVESMQYSYQFDEELQQDWEWSQRYSPQPEILKYARHVADRHDLRKDIQFNTRVTAAHFDDNSETWKVTTDDGKSTRARFFVTAVGCLSSFNKPQIPGIDDFKGKSYYTGAWPHEPVDFSGQNVAVIGTGSTAMQSSPEIAKQARNVTLFQRTPNYSIPSHNGPQDPEYVAYVKANYKRLRAEAKQIYGGVLDEFGEREGKTTPPDVMERELERRWQRGGLTFLGGYTDSMYDKDTNEFAAEFVRRKIREIVKDPETAELLCPNNEIGVKRICVDTGYFHIFNRPNVHLLDIRNTPIERITEKGILRGGVEHEFDSIVYATGFDAFTGSYLRIDIRGRSGRKLKDHWEAGPRNYIGMAIAGFPNMFTVTGPLSPSVFTNMLPTIEMSVEWITDAIGHVRARNTTVIEATEEAENEWVRHCDEVARPSLRYHADCWYLGSNIPGKPRVFMPYNAGLPAYSEKCDEVVANGYKGFAMS